jgi:hypothetical protein
MVALHLADGRVGFGNLVAALLQELRGSADEFVFAHPAGHGDRAGHSRLETRTTLAEGSRQQDEEEKYWLHGFREWWLPVRATPGAVRLIILG